MLEYKRNLRIFVIGTLNIKYVSQFFNLKIFANLVITYQECSEILPSCFVNHAQKQPQDLAHNKKHTF